MSTVVKAADLPPTLLHAFADALEAWGRLERELFMVWQLLNGSPNIEKAWEDFSWWSTGQQIDRTLKLVKKFLRKTQFAPGLPDVFNLLKELALTRHRIAHGRWHPIGEVVSGKRRVAEYIRLYDARGEPSRPVDNVDEKRMLGRSRFYETELKAAELQFRNATSEIIRAKAAMLASWRKWIA